MKPLHIALLLALLGGSAGAAERAAEVTLLSGRGTASTEDSVRELAKGDTVYSGELVASGPNSYMNLKFTDGGFILLRPNSRLHIEEFRNAAAAAAAAAAPAAPPAPGAPPPPLTPAPGAAAGESRAFFRLLRGGLRAVSGLVGKVDRNEYRVATPVATIGIRGTDFLAVICDAACAQDPIVRQDLPAGTLAEGGLVAGVFDGAIGLDSAKGCAAASAADAQGQEGDICVLSALQYLLVTRDGEPHRLAGMPRFLQVDPIPNPLTCAP